MKDLIEIIFKGFIGYLPVLVSVTSTPKPSILKLVTEDPSKLNKALTFCFISIAIGFVFQAPLLETSQDFVTIAGSLVAMKFIAILTFSGVIQKGVKLLGGKGAFETTLCATLYIASPIYLFVVVTYLIARGILAAYEPELVVGWPSRSLTPEQIHTFFSTSPLLASGFTLLLLSQILISVIWFVICWGVYRVVHEVSRIRSALVYIFALFMWYVYWTITIFIIKGLNKGELFPIV